MSTGIITVELDDVEQQVYDALNMIQSDVTNPEQWLIDALGGGSRSSSGAYVNYDSVLGIPAANRSINMICSHIAAMPKEVRKKRSDGGHELVPQSPAHVVSNLFCNDLQSCFTMWQTMMSHTLLLGNGRAFISRDGNGSPAALTPLMPNATYTIVVNGSKYHVTYFTNDQYNDVVSPELAAQLEPHTTSRTNMQGGTGYQYTIPDDEVFHIPGIGYTGMWGYPLTVLAKDSFGLELSGLDAVSYQFNNGGRPGLLLTAPRGLFRTEKEAAEFMANFRKQHGGTVNTGRTGMLREGMTAQLLEPGQVGKGLSELRDMSSDDIALLFGTEYLLGEKSAVYKDLPDRFTAYVTNTLNQWMETIEQEGNRKLIGKYKMRQGYYLHLDAFQLMRGSPNSLADYTGKLRTQGLISGNEGRMMHNKNPVPELEDDYGNPNITTNEPEPQEEPAEEPDTDDINAKLNLALIYTFENLIAVESRRVAQLTKKDSEPSKLIEGVDKFYDGFADRLSKTCRDLRVDQDKADDHIAESKGQLTEILAVTPREAVAEVVGNTVSKWKTRAREFTDAG